MAISNDKPIPESMVGKTIRFTASGVDDSGYGFVEFHFTDGTVFNVREIGQAGEIEWSINQHA